MPTKTATNNRITIGSLKVWLWVKWKMDSCGFKKATYIENKTNRTEKKICFNDKIKAP